MHKEFMNHFKSTLSSAKIIPTIITAISLFFLLTHVLSIPLTEVFINLYNVYKIIFHKIFDLIFFFLPEPPIFIKDIAIFYTFLGSAVSRIKMKERDIKRRGPWPLPHKEDDSTVLGYIVKTFRTIKNKTLYLSIASFIAIVWPYYLRDIFSKPFFAVPNGSHGPGLMHRVNTRAVSEPGNFYGTIYVSDVRLEMIAHLSAVFLICALFMGGNYLYSQQI